jgi:catechol 2,3-dioxygenase-like lactoylglutathione lyase family enzyme
MTIALDHLILAVNDRAASLDFYARVLDLAHEGDDGPFAVLRVTAELTLQLAPWGTKGGEHLAFALSRPAFDAAFQRLVEGEIPYGDSFHAVGNMRGPGRESGAKGEADAVYFFDPNQHLIEIRCYEAPIQP